MLRIQSECGEMRTRITSNTDTLYAMLIAGIWQIFISFAFTLHSLLSVLLIFLALMEKS